MTEKIPILRLLPEEIVRAVRERPVQDMPTYRAEQIFRWLHEKMVTRFEDMANLPASLRAALDIRFEITQLKELNHQTADDGSIKWLYETRGGDAAECVLIPTQRRRTLCISTQIGCKFGCKFCASGAAGFRRNLGTDEIIAQVLSVEQKSAVGPVSHVVVMGMGEPFDNFENLVQSLRILNHPWGRGIGKRRITISTVGLPKKILEFAKLKLPFELSVSLHSAIDSVRSSITPINQAFPVKKLFDACWTYTKETRRLITFEYILIEGVNCDEENAKALAKALKGRKAKVNLIPYNPIAEYPGKRPSPKSAHRFEQELKQVGIPTTMRSSKGSSVDAACGQLRIRHLN